MKWRYKSFMLGYGMVAPEICEFLNRNSLEPKDILITSSNLDTILYYFSDKDLE